MLIRDPMRPSARHSVRHDDPALSAFAASMPERYRALFNAACVREHAAIVGRRAGAPVHVELWRRQPRGGVAACVVADDRPGLLSFISAALVVHGLDVVGVQAYTRASRGGPEAVDFFWLQREGELPSPVLEGDIMRVAHVLLGLVTGVRTIDEVARQARAARAPATSGATHVTFDEDPEAGVAVLAVETFDRPGLLLAITRALHRARVQIIASEATTTSGRVVDRFTIVEFDGAPIRRQRRGILQMEVLAAVESLTAR